VYLILAHVKNFVRKLKFNNEIETTGTDQTMSWNSVQHDENALKHQQHGCLLIYSDLMLSMLLSIYGCGTDQTMSWNSVQHDENALKHERLCLLTYLL